MTLTEEGRVLRLIPAGIELAGYVLVGICVYFVNPVLLIGAGGLAAIALGNALSHALEKPE